MFSKPFYSTLFILMLSLTAGVAFAGIEYGDPDGGWTYVYMGDAAAPGADFTALDGTWNHDNGSDSWDESEIGSGNPGGVSILTEDAVTFARLQDTGDPRDYGMSDPSNRKLYFSHRMSDDGIDPAVGNTILDDGVTISFRARLATTPPLDDLHQDGSSATSPWPAGGNGYAIHHGGKGNFCVHQGEAEADGQIAFSLILAGDEQGGTKNPDRSGLCMPNLNGNAISGDIDIEGNDAGTLNLLDIEDLTIWHEFWITIEADATGTGTHLVKIYMDGSSTATEFIVTASNETENAGDGPNIGLGMGSTASHGAIDVDFFAYKPGIIPPVPSDPFKARAITPYNGTIMNLSEATLIAWTAGEGAVQHDVYFGTDQDDVNDADITDTSGIYKGRQNIAMYTPAETLELGGMYYWRIDEVEADDTTIHRGDVWSFTILDHIIIDNFEDYDAGNNEIWWAWKDGLGYAAHDNEPAYSGNGTGAAVGDETTNSFTEETIIHGGRKSMPYFYNNNKDGYLKYSEATKTLTKARDWTEQGVKALSLWFRGYPPFLGGFIEAPAGTFTMSGEGTDIGGNSDQFHFAWQQLQGAGSITVRVQSIQDTDPEAKAGVMIRDTLDADSAHAILAVTPGNGLWFGRRTSAGGTTDSDILADMTAPLLLKIERSSGGLMRTSYSTGGFGWTQLGSSIPINMNIPLYIGLAVTSHNPGVACEAVFSNVTSDGTGTWTNQDIGLSSNEAEQMYVTIANNNGTSATIKHEDPNATFISAWTQWNIDLKDFSDQGVDLTNVNSITIGFGDPENPQPGGSGKMFIDDISLYRPRYLPDKVVPLTADFTDDGIVNFSDLEIMMNDWLMGDFTRSGPLLVHYKFDEGAGTVAADSSGLGSDGTFSGTAAWSAEGRMGAAASFDGGVGEVRGNSPHLNGLDEISFGAWIKSNVVGTDAGAIIFANPAGNDQRDLRYDLAGGTGGGTNVIKYGVSTEEGSHENESASNVQTTQWQHVMVTWKSGEAAKLYINGVLDTPTAVADIIGGTTTDYNTVIVGRGGKDTGGSWDGLVDDVRVYEIALTAQQVQTVMNGGDLPVADTYVPLKSQANISDDEPANSKKVNFKDFAVLADEWLQQLLWPSW